MYSRLCYGLVWSSLAQLGTQRACARWLAAGGGGVGWGPVLSCSVGGPPCLCRLAHVVCLACWPAGLAARPSASVHRSIGHEPKFVGLRPGQPPPPRPTSPTPPPLSVSHQPINQPICLVAERGHEDPHQAYAWQCLPERQQHPDALPVRACLVQPCPAWPGPVLAQSLAGGGWRDM